MEVKKVLSAFEKAGKKVHFMGDFDAGLLIALDMEGRLFTVLDGEVINRVNLDAIAGDSTRNGYLNPGGDGLWPAPEGTAYGYQYTTGAWRVSPAICAARYRLVGQENDKVSIASEIDLISNRGLGIPTLFTREIGIVKGIKSIEVNVLESITYLGNKTLSKSDFLIAPWTLCQFDCGPGCEVRFPAAQQSSVWDLYEESSDSKRNWVDGMCRTSTDGSTRYQIGIGSEVPWIEFWDPGRKLLVRRQAAGLDARQSYIDIRDAGPDQLPDGRGVRYSVYSDSADFMEIEAVGGCPDLISTDTALSVLVNTTFTKL